MRILNGRTSRINHPLLKVTCDDSNDARHWCKFAILIASQYTGRTSLDTDELVSAAMEGVAVALKKEANTDRRAQVRLEIHKAISTAIEYAEPIRVPHSSDDRLGEHEQQFVPRSRVEMPDVAGQEVRCMELVEEILACCSSDLERDIVIERARGMSDSDIAKLHGYSRQTIWILRKEIEARYEQRSVG